MDRNREARRASIVGSNGFNRRRHRTNSLRDSPDEDGGLESQDSVRLRDRVKKDRDRERERERDRERERERERDRERDLRERSSRSKRRRGERLTSNREDTGGDETSEESVNDDEDEDDEETTAAASVGGVRLLSPAVGTIPNHHHHHGHISNHHPSHSSSFSQQQHNSNSTSNIVSSNHHLQHRKSFPPNSSSAKVLRGPPVWKSGDEMISVSIPRKARSASTKRSHDWISSSSNNNSGGGVSGEQNPGPPSSSPARQVVVPAAAPLPAAPMSPSSSNASIRKKLKPSVNNSGPKLKPPKVSSKLSSSNPEELEIEIAEVLYGLMTQSQGPSSKKEEINRLNSDVKSKNSSPISNSTPLSAVAPKRKRPRQIPENSSSGYGVRSSPVSAKPDADQAPKSEIPSPNLEKKIAAENGFEIGGNLVNSHVEVPAPTPPESTKSEMEARLVDEELRENRDLKGEMSSPKERESPAMRAEDSNNGDSPSTVTVSSASAMIKANSVVAEMMENQREEKFQIDLMAPPPQARSSPEREKKVDLPMDQKPVVLSVEANPKAIKEQDEEVSKSGKNQEKKGKGSGEDVESKGRNVDLHLDLEKSERDGGDGAEAATGNKLSQLQTQRQPPTEKSGHSTSPLPLPMSMASWPGGLPPMGYMAPLQGVVSMDGGTVAPGHIQQLFSQPRPKRCATHCHIARNIYCLQQFMKMNPFWPPPTAGSASMFGSKPCNLNVLPAGDMHGNARGVSNAQDKGQNVVSVPSHAGKDKGSQPNNSNQDSTQRKQQQQQQQILIQQALPPVAPSNLLGPAFIFPLNQQQSAVVARPSGAKSPANGASSNASSSAVTSTSSAATAMSFNYPNMGSNETQQYLAILQNNAYTFPIPTVGAPPNYRGNPAQAMPLFNGSFYSSPMIHPSQLQHPQSVQSAQLLQAHQNANASGGSSSSQKHMQSQQQRTQSGGGVSGGSQKTQPPQQYAHPSRPRHLESELGGEESPSTTDSRGSRTSMNIYGQNFAMPIHPQNFALMTNPAAMAAAAAASSASSNQNDKKPHQQQQPGVKTGAEGLPPHGFAMSFGTINGANAGQGIDIASMAHNHAVMFQSSSEVAVRQNMQMMAAAQAAQKKNFRISDDGKSGGVDSSTMDDERKSLQGKGQSIAFARQDLTDGQVASIQPNNVIESSGRTLNVGSGGGARTSRSMTSNAMSAVHMSNAHNIQVQLQQQQMMQLKHQQQQQQQLAANAVNRSKVAVTSNGSIYSEHMNSSSSTMAAKFPNALSGFPQNLVQSNSSSSPSQSPQWKNPTRTPTPQAPSSTTTGVKNLPQQHSRSQAPMHNQISFGGNQKPTTTQPPQSSNNQAPSSPMMVGSPTTSKGASGSPRTTSSASTNNKIGQASALSAQPPKNSPSAPNHKSPSILGNPHIASSSTSSGGPKPQMQPQQQLPKAMQQSQLFFSNPYNQSPPPHSVGTSTTASVPSGFYMQRRRPDQHQQGPGAPPSNGGLSLCPPVTMSSSNTNDPATAIAAATANVKGGMMHGSQFAGQSGGTLFPYVHPVQVKPAEQKQPAGNDNLHQWQPEKK